jgi:dolichol-phosphate mannosyltransferase
MSLEVMDSRRPRISVIIPARNEVTNLPFVIEHARPYADELLVVDGHSSDGTAQKALELGARVVVDNGVGKGDAVRVGIAEARGDILVLIDADCSHNPHDIPALVAPILDGTAEHVTGSRMLGGSEELHGDFAKFVRCLGSDIITLGINYRYGVALTDSQNGFRALRADVARQLDLREEITTIEQEMIIKTLALGYRVVEVPARESVRRAGASCIDVKRVAGRYVYSWLKYIVTHAPPKGLRGRSYHPYNNPHPWWGEPGPRLEPAELRALGPVRP